MGSSYSSYEWRGSYSSSEWREYSCIYNGKLFLANNQFNLALQSFQQCLTFNPINKDAMTYLGLI